MLQKPERGGIPISAKEAIHMKAHVNFISLREKFMSVMYMECDAWIRTPAQRNKAALKIPWFMRWKIPDVNPSTKAVGLMPATPKLSIM